MLICPQCDEYREALIVLPVTVQKEDNDDGIQQTFTRQGFGTNASICFRCLETEIENI